SSFFIVESVAAVLSGDAALSVAADLSVAAGLAGDAALSVAAGLAGGVAGVAGCACAKTVSEAEAKSIAIRADSFFMFGRSSLVQLSESINVRLRLKISVASPTLTARIIPGLTKTGASDRC